MIFIERSVSIPASGLRSARSYFTSVKTFDALMPLTERHASSPLNVAFGGSSLMTPLTGIGQYTWQLSRELLALQVTPHFFLNTHWNADAKPHHAGQEQAGVQGVWMRAARRLLASAPLARRASRALQSWRFRRDFPSDAELYHEPNFLPYAYGERPTVITVHDVSWIRYPDTHPAGRVSLMQKHFPEALRRADRILVVSHFVRAELLALCEVNPEKIRVVHNGVADRFRPYADDALHTVLPRYGLLPRRYFMALGTLEPRKCLSTALLAHARLPAALRQHFPLVLVGSKGWLTGPLERALAPGVARGEVRLLGYVVDQDLPFLVGGAMATVYPSIYEGFGLPPLESMACGVPAICSDRSAISEVVEDGGVLLEPDDIDGFSTAMARAAGDDTWRAQLAEQGLQRAAQFSWKRCARETLAVYRELVPEPSA